MFHTAQLARRLQNTSRQVTNLAFLDVAGRIAQTLMNLAKQPEAMTHPDGMQIKITRQEIGQMVGCSPETMGALLRCWRIRILSTLMEKQSVYMAKENQSIIKIFKNKTIRN